MDHPLGHISRRQKKRRRRRRKDNEEEEEAEEEEAEEGGWRMEAQPQLIIDVESGLAQDAAKRQGSQA